jgi:tetratricopeptide (TPR) repeat protein
VAKCVDHLDESIELEKKGLALDPLVAHGHGTLAWTLYSEGRYDEAEAAVQKALEMNPRLGIVHYTWGVSLLAQGHTDEALAKIQQESWEQFRLLGEVLVYRASGRQQESEAALNELIAKHQNDSPYQIAQAYAYRQETDKAFEWLNRAYQQHDGALLNVKFDPLLKSLRQDPRYADLVRKMHL